jgi:hypothetical protein
VVWFSKSASDALGIMPVQRCWLEVRAARWSVHCVLQGMKGEDEKSLTMEKKPGPGHCFG